MNSNEILRIPMEILRNHNLFVELLKLLRITKDCLELKLIINNFLIFSYLKIVYSVCLLLFIIDRFIGIFVLKEYSFD